MCVCLCGYVQVLVQGPKESRESTSGPLELESQAAVSILMQMPGANLGSFARAECFPNHGTILRPCRV